MKNVKRLRIRISIRILMLLTLLAAIFIRARVSPMPLSITINSNGQFEHNGKPLPATGIQDVLQTYQTSQSWWLSRSILKIVAPGNLAPKRNVQDAMNYVSLSAHFLQFDKVSIDWYTSLNSPTANFSPDSQLTQLLQKLRTAKFP